MYAAVAIIETRERRRKSIIVSAVLKQAAGHRQHTKNKLLCRCEHIYSKGDFVLIDLEADPANQSADDPDKERHGGAG